MPMSARPPVRSRIPSARQWLATLTVLLCSGSTLALDGDGDCDGDSLYTNICGQIQSHGKSWWAPQGGGISGTNIAVLDTSKPFDGLRHFTLIRLSDTTFWLMTEANTYLSVPDDGNASSEQEVLQPIRTDPERSPQQRYLQFRIDALNRAVQDADKHWTLDVNLRSIDGHLITLAPVRAPELGGVPVVTVTCSAHQPNCPGPNETFTWIPSPDESAGHYRTPMTPVSHPNCLNGAMGYNNGTCIPPTAGAHAMREDDGKDRPGKQK